jgi:uncharacterized protein involved in exopolysaccharide biosynthesis
MSTNQENTSQANIDNDGISFNEFILIAKKWTRFLKSKWKTIFLAGIIGGLIGIFIYWFEKPTYKATLTFAMEEDKGIAGGLGGALGLASSFGIDIGGGSGGAFAAINLTELMKSRLIVEKVLLKPIQYKENVISLAEYYIIMNKYRDEWKKNPRLEKLTFLPNSDRNKFNRLQDSIFKKFYEELSDKNNLSIKQKDKKMSIISIEFESFDENFSKIFCENIAKETSDFYIETKSRKARMNVEVLQKQLDSARYELNNAITTFASETDDVYNLNPAYNIKNAPSKKRQIDIQANTAIITNLVVQLELAKIGLRKETPLIQLIDSPILPLDNENFGPKFLFLICSFIFCILTSLYLIFMNFKKQ